MALVLYPNFLTRELTIPLGFETDYRWVHIFNELHVSAHESPSNKECSLESMTLNIDKVTRRCVFAGLGKVISRRTHCDKNIHIKSNLSH